MITLAHILNQTSRSLERQTPTQPDLAQGEAASLAIKPKHVGLGDSHSEKIGQVKTGQVARIAIGGQPQRKPKAQGDALPQSLEDLGAQRTMEQGGHAALASNSLASGLGQPRADAHTHMGLQTPESERQDISARSQAAHKLYNQNNQIQSVQPQPASVQSVQSPAAQEGVSVKPQMGEQIGRTQKLQGHLSRSEAGQHAADLRRVSTALQVQSHGIKTIEHTLEALKTVTAQATAIDLTATKRIGLAQEVSELVENLSETVAQAEFGGRPLLSSPSPAPNAIAELSTPEQPLKFAKTVTADEAPTDHASITSDITSAQLEGYVRTVDSESGTEESRLEQLEVGQTDASQLDETSEAQAPKKAPERISKTVHAAQDDVASHPHKTRFSETEHLGITVAENRPVEDETVHRSTELKQVEIDQPAVHARSVHSQSVRSQSVHIPNIMEMRSDTPSDPQASPVQALDPSILPITALPDKEDTVADSLRLDAENTIQDSKTMVAKQAPIRSELNEIQQKSEISPHHDRLVTKIMQSDETAPDSTYSTLATLDQSPSMSKSVAQTNKTMLAFEAPRSATLISDGVAVESIGAQATPVKVAATQPQQLSALPDGATAPQAIGAQATPVEVAATQPQQLSALPDGETAPQAIDAQATPVKVTATQPQQLSALPDGATALQAIDAQATPVKVAATQPQQLSALPDGATALQAIDAQATPVKVAATQPQQLSALPDGATALQAIDAQATPVKVAATQPQQLSALPDGETAPQAIGAQATPVKVAATQPQQLSALPDGETAPQAIGAQATPVKVAATQPQQLSALPDGATAPQAIGAQATPVEVAATQPQQLSALPDGETAPQAINAQATPVEVTVTQLQQSGALLSGETTPQAVNSQVTPVEAAAARPQQSGTLPNREAAPQAIDSQATPPVKTAATQPQQSGAFPNGEAAPQVVDSQGTSVETANARPYQQSAPLSNALQQERPVQGNIANKGGPESLNSEALEIETARAFDHHVRPNPQTSGHGALQLPDQPPVSNKSESEAIKATEDLDIAQTQLGTSAPSLSEANRTVSVSLASSQFIQQEAGLSDSDLPKPNSSETDSSETDSSETDSSETDSSETNLPVAHLDSPLDSPLDSASRTHIATDVPDTLKDAFNVKPADAESLEALSTATDLESNSEPSAAALSEDNSGTDITSLPESVSLDVGALGLGHLSLETPESAQEAQERVIQALSHVKRALEVVNSTLSKIEVAGQHFILQVDQTAWKADPFKAGTNPLDQLHMHKTQKFEEHGVGALAVNAAKGTVEIPPSLAVLAVGLPE